MGRFMEKLFLSLSIFLIIGAVWYGTPLIAEYKKGADSYKEAEETYVTRKNQREDTEKGEEKKEGKQPGKPSEKRKKKGEDRTQAEESAQTEQTGKTVPISVDFEKLRERNPDVRGWIYIESIDLSYPVMQGTDNEYYLKHTWDGEEVFSASIFMDYRNAPDFGDYNTILYGHNMKDGSMFHKIQYCMDGEYYARSPYIWILTPEGDFRYEIFRNTIPAMTAIPIPSLGQREKVWRNTSGRCRDSPCGSQGWNWKERSISSPCPPAMGRMTCAVLSRQGLWNNGKTALRHGVVKFLQKGGGRHTGRSKPEDHCPVYPQRENDR